MEKFLDASGIHGVNYLHSRNHCIGRLYWVSQRHLKIYLNLTEAIQFPNHLKPGDLICLPG